MAALRLAEVFAFALADFLNNIQRCSLIEKDNLAYAGKYVTKIFDFGRERENIMLNPAQSQE